MAFDIGKMRWLMFEQGSSSISAVAGGAGFLACHCFRQLRPLRSCESNRYCYVIPVRTIGFRGDLLDPGDVHPFPGMDPDFQCSAAQRAGAAGAVAGPLRGDPDLHHWGERPMEPRYNLPTDRQCAY